MNNPLRLLIVEDAEADAVLVVGELQRGGYSVAHERVDTPEAMAKALSARPWDLVISDWTMQRFSAPQALQLVRERGLDLPFIIVSGTASEEIAVDAFHAGAHDFMAKHRLARLVPAVERGMHDFRLRAEKKKLQHQLTISDRMASMGTLAAGVAHEINNPLSCVVANLELASRRLAAHALALGVADRLDDVKDEIDDARAAAMRIRDIVSDLRIFSRSDDEPSGLVDVAKVMESTLRMASNQIRHRARLVKSYGRSPRVQASESRLSQVFLNLVVNAAQAIPEGRARDNEIRISTATDPSGRAVVEIADTGSGMAPGVIERLFTPFFTTKPAGVGTGLGLSICHRIVSDLGGTISVTSELGRGTTFTVALPPASDAARAASPHASGEYPARRGGRVLVIDDELMITRLIQRVLSTEHEVMTCVRADEALRMVEAGVRFDVILCDLVMPQMTGMEFHARLLKVNPSYAEAMIFMTGGAFTPSSQEFIDRVSNERIEKPFDARELRKLINHRIR